MKIQVLWKFGSVLILSSVIATGCRKSSAPQKTSEQPADSVLAFRPVPNEEETQIAADPSEDIAMPDPEIRISTPQIPLPPGVAAGGPLSEVIRFAESGVEENVILAYITNSRTSFDLGPDEIIYLNDLGVPASVITRMLEHNVALKKTLAQPGLKTNSVAAPSPPVTTPPDDIPAPEFVALPAPGSSSPDYSDITPPEPPPEDYDNSGDFHDALAPYGTWVDVRGYGRCWQPAAVMANPDWRPYFDRGHWISTDCGWYWSSDYTWGWAPFHYGRWFQHAQLGWCWTPGSVWAPSWVTWRYSNDVCGWAPLPPGSRFIPSIGFAFNGRPVSSNFGFGLAPACFAFTSFQYFFDPHLSHHGLPVDQATRYFRSTVGATKIVMDHNRVANQGLAPSHVTAMTHRPIQPVRIQGLSDGSKVAGNRNEQVDPQGRTLTVYRPHLRSQVGAAQIASQRVDLTGTPPNPAQVLDPVRTVPHVAAGPRTVDLSALALPVRQLRVNETEIPTLPVSQSHPIADIQASTSPTRLDDSTHNLPERPLRPSPVHGRGASARVEDAPEKYPPHSLIVIGRKDSRAGEHDRYVPPSPVLPVSAPNPVNENPGSQLQVQTPDRSFQPPQAIVPRGPAPEVPWARPAAVSQQPVEHRVAIQPEQPRPAQPDVPRHVETPAPVHERVHSAPVESRPPPAHQESAPRPAPPPPAAPAPGANSSGERDTHRR